MDKSTVKPAASLTSSATNTKDRGVGDTDGDEAWRVLLLRALVMGDVDRTDHIDVLSLPFTESMPDWKVQWESLYWWMLRDATPLFIAAAYSHPELVHWLLLRGADRTSKGYLGRTPLDFVGECCETATNAVVARSDACRKLLMAAPGLPAPPHEGVRFACHVSSQIVVVQAPLSSSSSSSSSSPFTRAMASGAASPLLTQQTIYKCLVEVTWAAPLSHGALIEKYELRHRLLAEDGDVAGGGGASDNTSSWRIERAPHNRKARGQRLLLENLQFDSTYEFMVRSWNAAGKGDWGRAYKFPTQASPEQAATMR